MKDSIEITVALIILVLLFPTIGNAEDTGQTKSAAEIATELSNPNATLGYFTVDMDYITYKGDLPDAGSQEAYRTSFQPTLPYPIAKDTNVFLRPLIPIYWKQPVFDGSDWNDVNTELGDIAFDFAVGKTFPNGLVAIGGVTGTLNTATDDDIGLNQTLMGPEALLGKVFGWGYVGLLVSHQWEVTGSRDQSITGGQYFFSYDLKNAWQIQMQPTWSYDHEADSDDAWTLPLAIGVSKTITAGNMHVKFSLEYWHYVESPDTFGPDNQVRFRIVPVIGLPW